MEPEDILGQLNEPQREAVTSGANPVMVLAGAGSGKTRVLVHRIAWLIGVDNISPFNVFAVTFTNKAANEMRERISEMLGLETRSMCLLSLLPIKLPMKCENASVKCWA